MSFLQLSGSVSGLKLDRHCADATAGAWYPAKKTFARQENRPIAAITLAVAKVGRR